MDAEQKGALRAATSWPELRRLLGALDLEALGPRDAHLIHRALGRCGGEPDLRVAFLGNHTLEPLPAFVAACSALEGLLVATFVGPYGQHFQEVLSPESELAAFDPDVILLELGMRGLAPRVAGEFLSLTAEERHKERDQLLHGLLDWVQVARERTRATLLVANFPPPPFPQAGIADAKVECGEAEFYAQLNLDLLRALRPDPRARLFDLAGALGRAGTLRARDPKLFYLAKMAWSEACHPHVAEEILRHLRALRGLTRKCLVLDLDDTLWGGIVGEDGPLGVRIGEGDPESEAFADFQRAIRCIEQRGVLLAICSKNNPEDALEVFEKRPSMPLSLDDFAAVRINWEPKHLNLQSIARELNLGIDSLVFVDDNPAECELVRQMLPEVKTIELPRDPALYAGLLQRSSEFEKLVLTADDREKSSQYRGNARREAHKQQVGDLAAFLESLGTVIRIGRAGPQHVARIHQLFSKTNQFNVTTRRYGQAEVERFVADEGWEVGVLEVSDRFGDLGIVGLYLVERLPDRARIDSVVLSCRAMGRGVETALMNRIKQDFLLDGSFLGLEALYLPTAKNKPAERYFESEGFAVCEVLEGGGKRYRMERRDAGLLACPGTSVRGLEET